MATSAMVINLKSVAKGLMGNIEMSMPLPHPHSHSDMDEEDHTNDSVIIATLFLLEAFPLLIEVFPFIFDSEEFLLLGHITHYIY